jgi:hypothetical protein
MTTVIFVHGTGVREEAYEQSFEKADSVLGKLAGVTVKRCYWGHLGSALRAGGASVPEYDLTRAVEDTDATTVTDEEYLVALWGILYEDPLYELRILAVRSGDVSEQAPPQLSSGAALAQRGQLFKITPGLRSLLERGGIFQEFEPARLAVTSSTAYDDALAEAQPPLGDYRAAVARALIAEAVLRVTRLRTLPPVARDARLRDETEQTLIEALGGEERSIGGWVKQQFCGLVFRLGTPYVERRRGAITEAAYPAAGDILLYQARGKEIRDFIRQQVAEAAGPRVILAHSLGGIACVDLLVAEPLDIQLLVTVGSQAPFLYEINALQSLNYGEPLPAHFAKWLNIYDLRDFLSYKGGKIFSGKVTDVPVDNRQAFPVSHSAYWENDDVWDVIAKELP